MNYSTKIFRLLLSLIIVSVVACKKDNDEETNPQTPTAEECNLTTNAIVLDGTQFGIVKSNCFSPFAGSYYSEHMSDTSSAAPKGIVMVFNGTAAPVAGDYTITPNAGSIAAGQVFVEYYNTASSWHGSSGTVKVTDSGSSKVYSFCKISCTDGTATKILSVRATCN